MDEDLYGILGVEKDADADKIKKAYRNLAFKYHPDRNAGDSTAEEKFKKINEAYSVLGDESKRKTYDLYGSSSNANYQNNYNNSYNNSYQRYSNTYSDPWKEAFGEESEFGEFYKHTYKWENQKTAPTHVTKKQAWGMLFQSAFITALSFLCFRVSFYIFPIGPILTITGLVKGISGFFNAIKVIASPEK